ncbi:MAG: response regulator transcription factor [Spirochaetales bacterium]|nr:response regulator transcription factor [Spirochaetales bacterium]
MEQQGLQIKEIASKLFLSVHTVRNYIRRIYTKCEVQSRIGEFVQGVGNIIEKIMKKLINSIVISRKICIIFLFYHIDSSLRVYSNSQAGVKYPTCKCGLMVFSATAYFDNFTVFSME